MKNWRLILPLGKCQLCHPRLFLCYTHTIVCNSVAHYATLLQMKARSQWKYLCHHQLIISQQMFINKHILRIHWKTWKLVVYIRISKSFYGMVYVNQTSIGRHSRQIKMWKKFLYDHKIRSEEIEIDISVLKKENFMW
jgi:hypothetical protein